MTSVKLLCMSHTHTHKGIYCSYSYTFVHKPAHTTYAYFDTCAHTHTHIHICANIFLGSLLISYTYNSFLLLNLPP